MLFALSVSCGLLESLIGPGKGTGRPNGGTGARSPQDEVAKEASRVVGAHGHLCLHTEPRQPVPG
jgi:hypothetical protein